MLNFECSGKCKVTSCLHYGVHGEDHSCHKPIVCPAIRKTVVCHSVMEKLLQREVKNGSMA